MLLRSWAAQTDTAVAWVTVERGERDAQRFWLSVIDALADAAGDEVVERVSPAPRFTGAVVVERLLAQLERLDKPPTWLSTTCTSSPPTTRSQGWRCCWRGCRNSYGSCS